VDCPRNNGTDVIGFSVEDRGAANVINCELAVESDVVTKLRMGYSDRAGLCRIFHEGAG
jgi:hypothetical protein